MRWYVQQVQPPEDALTVQDLAVHTSRRTLHEVEPQEDYTASCCY